MLAERPDELVLGGSWGGSGRATEVVEPIEPADFAAFEAPGFAKAVMNFHARAVDGGTLLTTETRIRGTDEEARRRFRRYWRVVMPGSALIRRAWLRAIRRRAERSPGSDRRSLLRRTAAVRGRRYPRGPGVLTPRYGLIDHTPPCSEARRDPSAGRAGLDLMGMSSVPSHSVTRPTSPPSSSRSSRTVPAGARPGCGPEAAFPLPTRRRRGARVRRPPLDPRQPPAEEAAVAGGREPVLTARPSRPATSSSRSVRATQPSGCPGADSSPRPPSARTRFRLPRPRRQP